MVRHPTTIEIETVITPHDLPGTLVIPPDARGVVLFAHGSGSSRRSPRNSRVANALHDRHLGTLLFDLLTENEGLDRRNVFDISLLADRLLSATDWVADRPETDGLTIGYFGASTGAAAALVAAARSERYIGAVVSRGGRPDLAGDRLRLVRAPTLLIVGARDEIVIELNRAAFAELRCEKSLELVPDATHLFEEPGTLDQVIELAGRWFEEHLSPATA